MIEAKVAAPPPIYRIDNQFENDCGSENDGTSSTEAMLDFHTITVVRIVVGAIVPPAWLTAMSSKCVGP